MARKKQLKFKTQQQIGAKLKKDVESFPNDYKLAIKEKCGELLLMFRGDYNKARTTAMVLLYISQGVYDNLTKQHIEAIANREEIP